ncbi:hypothetical protein [Streptomyces sp. XY533]|nr:hypothetical protein [Streptomyces sp. XY533]
MPAQPSPDGTDRRGTDELRRRATVARREPDEDEDEDEDDGHE